MRNGPLTPPNIWGLHSVQSTPQPWHCLRDDVYKVCSGPLIPERWSLPVCNQPLLRIRFSQCTMSPSPPPPPPRPGRWDLPSVQWAPHPFRGKRLTIPSVECWGLPSVQWAPHPGLCLRDEVHPIWNQPHLQPPLLPEMKRTSVQPVSHPSWEISFFQCAILTP